MLDIGMGELVGLAVVALLVLGPDKLPKFAADAARFVRQVRQMANTAREDVRRELGPQLQGISLEDLNPKTALRKHVLTDLDLDDDDGEGETGRGKGATGRGKGATGRGKGPAQAGTAGAGAPTPYDPDAT